MDRRVQLNEYAEQNFGGGIFERVPVSFESTENKIVTHPKDIQSTCGHQPFKAGMKPGRSGGEWRVTGFPSCNRSCLPMYNI
jgi:hypothetical protein